MTQQHTHIDRRLDEGVSRTESNRALLDQRSDVVAAPALPRLRADAFARQLGGTELGELRTHHLALAMAVIELAADADDPLPWSHDDPTVALLRATAKLAITAPHATSSAAAALVDRLATTPASATPPSTARA